MGCSPWGREESGMTERLHFHFSLSCIGEGNGNPLQCSCPETPRDGGTWWAVVYGVAASFVSNSVRTHRRQPTRLLCPLDSPGKNTGVGCHFLLQCMKVKSESEVSQSCPTLSDPMDWCLPGSSIHGIFQARVQEWGAIFLVSHYLSWKDGLYKGQKWQGPNRSRRH